MRALLIDAYDSFVHIIDQYLQELDVETRVLRCDRASAAVVEADAPDFLVLGPGPGRPEQAGYPEILEASGGRRPVLGVCLGHQAVGMAFGARVARAKAPRHGKTSAIRHDGKGCFASQPDPFAATRYHSLVVDGLEGAPDLVVTARAEDDGHVMGLRHRSLAIESVQFHPESIATASGLNLFRDFVRTYLR